MKRTVLLFAFIFAFTFSKSQNHSIFNIGVGMPFFFQSNFNETSGGSHSISSKRINAFIEKSGLFSFTETKNLYITPGAGYFLFNENGSGGGLGGGYSESLKHQAFSIYGKFLYEPGFNSDNNFNLYLGFLTGVYLYTETTGERSWWIMQQLQNRSGTSEVNESGESFFNSIYMGFLIGFNPLGKKSSSFINPLIEFSFFPNYAIIYDDNISEDEQKLSKNMAMISVAFGFN